MMILIYKAIMGLKQALLLVLLNVKFLLSLLQIQALLIVYCRCISPEVSVNIL